MDVLPFVIIMVISVVVAVAWQILDERYKSNNKLKRQPKLSERVEKIQIQTPIEKVDKNQMQIERINEKEAEISNALEQVLEIISRENNQKTTRKKAQKADIK